MIHIQTYREIKALLPERPADSHKGMNGHSLLFVGSNDYIGAAVLCAKAALRGGSGKTTVVTPEPVRAAFYSIPEVMSVSIGAQDWNEAASRDAARYIEGNKAIAIGCGVGRGDISPLIKAALESKLPLVIDADGLNQLAVHPELWPLLHPRVVLTPHLGEMARLMNTDIKRLQADNADIARSFSKKWGCVVLLKSAVSYISDGDRLVANHTGSSALSKGGSGDVLCGLVTALLAQGLEPFDAARAGAYILGTSADMAMELLEKRMLNASDLLDAIEQGL